MTLIVAAASADDAQEVSRTLGELIHEHPSRVIVLKPGPAGSELESRVFAQCWMPFGRRQQICCEQIEITAALDRLENVPRMILGLVAPDLPVVLWSRGERWLKSRDFHLVFPLADKLIVDSRERKDARKAFSEMQELKGEVGHIADLAWTSLTGWRETIAQTLTAPTCEKALHQIRTIRVVQSQSSSTEGWYLAAWLSRAHPPAAITVESTESTGGIARVELAGENTGFQFFASGPTVVVEAGTPALPVIEPPSTDYSTMREELSIIGGDPVFEEVFEIANRLVNSPSKFPSSHTSP
jgi:glucose-6-phosphate dehydrogenase assembly protein OpcA